MSTATIPFTLCDELPGQADYDRACQWREEAYSDHEGPDMWDAQIERIAELEAELEKRNAELTAHSAPEEPDEPETTYGREWAQLRVQFAHYHLKSVKNINPTMLCRMAYGTDGATNGGHRRTCDRYLKQSKKPPKSEPHLPERLREKILKRIQNFLQAPH